MSRAIANRLERLESARTDIHTQLVVRRHGEDVALFSRTIRYLDPCVIQLEWPERDGADGDNLLLSEHEPFVIGT